MRLFLSLRWVWEGSDSLINLYTRWWVVTSSSAWIRLARWISFQTRWAILKVPMTFGLCLMIKSHQVCQFFTWWAASLRYNRVEMSCLIFILNSWVVPVSTRISWSETVSLAELTFIFSLLAARDRARCLYFFLLMICVDGLQRLLGLSRLVAFANGLELWKEFLILWDLGLDVFCLLGRVKIFVVAVH